MKNYKKNPKTEDENGDEIDEKPIRVEEPRQRPAQKKLTRAKKKSNANAKTKPSQSCCSGTITPKSDY